MIGLAKIASDPNDSMKKEKEFLVGAAAAKGGAGLGLATGNMIGRKVKPPISLGSEGTNSRHLFNLAQNALKKNQTKKFGLAGAGIGAGLGVAGTMLGFNVHDHKLEHNGKPVLDELRDLEHPDQQEKTADYAEDEWYNEQRSLHPEFDKLMRNYEEKEKNYEDLDQQLDPQLKEKAMNAQNNLLFAGGSLGTLAGLAGGAGVGYLLHKDRPGVLGRVRQGFSMTGRGAGGALIGGLGGSALGLMASIPFTEHYDRKQQKKNPELYQQVQQARHEVNDADDAVNRYEFEHFE